MNNSNKADAELAKLRYLAEVSEQLFNDFIGLIGPDSDFPIELKFRHCTGAERVRTFAAIVEFKQVLGKTSGQFTCAGPERTQTAQGLEELE